jgi:hypothetical protein
MKKFLIGLSVALVFSGTAFAGMHSEGDDLPKGKPGDRHCMYRLQNLMMDAPVKTCQEPANEEGCATLGTTDSNSDAVHGAGSCPMEGAKGVCDTGDVKLVYYDEELGGLEIGCGFQGGDWIVP